MEENDPGSLRVLRDVLLMCSMCVAALLVAWIVWRFLPGYPYEAVGFPSTVLAFAVMGFLAERRTLRPAALLRLLGAFALVPFVKWAFDGQLTWRQIIWSAEYIAASLVGYGLAAVLSWQARRRNDQAMNVR